jgi:nicotinamidase-related amidase
MEVDVPRTFEFTIDKTALVVVDLQNDFVRRGAPMLVEEALGTVRANKRLIAFARENGMPVIFTKFMAGRKPSLLWNWSPEIASQHSCVRGFERFYPDIGKKGLCCDIIDEFKPLSNDDYIVEKYHYSSFRNTNLIDILRNEGAEAIAVTGTVTQLCVMSTVHDAFHEGIKAIVASDCVSTWDRLQEQATLENIKHKFGMVMTSEELMKSLK